MINGSILVDDQLITFSSNNITGRTQVSIKDLFIGMSEHYETNSVDFSKALAIAVHWEGMPDNEKDYPAAERAQGTIRWIP